MSGLGVMSGVVSSGVSGIGVPGISIGSAGCGIGVVGMLWMSFQGSGAVFGGVCMFSKPDAV